MSRVCAFMYESTRAIRALEWFGAIVDTHMSIKCFRLDKCSLTYIAFVRTFAGVNTEKRNMPRLRRCFFQWNVISRLTVYAHCRDQFVRNSYHRHRIYTAFLRCEICNERKYISNDNFQTVSRTHFICSNSKLWIRKDLSHSTQSNGLSMECTVRICSVKPQDLLQVSSQIPQLYSVGRLLIRFRMGPLGNCNRNTIHMNVNVGINSRQEYIQLSSPSNR